MNCVIEKADALEFLRSFEDESVDLIVTDPPYESLEKYRKTGTTTRLKKSKGSNNEWFPIFSNTLFPKLFEELFRVLKKNRHCYILCDATTMFVAKPIGEKAGFKIWTPIIWYKTGGLGMGYHYRSCYEVILFFEKGKRKLNDLSIPNVLSINKVRGGYPTEKPVDLLEILIKQSTEPGEVVVDPFLGSGSTAVAAVQNARDFYGCDIKKKAVKLAKKRSQK